MLLMLEKFPFNQTSSHSLVKPVATKTISQTWWIIKWAPQRVAIQLRIEQVTQAINLGHITAFRSESYFRMFWLIQSKMFPVAWIIVNSNKNATLVLQYSTLIALTFERRNHRVCHWSKPLASNWFIQKVFFFFYHFLISELRLLFPFGCSSGYGILDQTGNY